MPFYGVEVRLGACVLTEFDAHGFLRAQPHALGDNPQVESYELLQAYGFLARAPEAEVDPDGRPIQGKACSLLYWSQGDRNFAMQVGDPRPIGQLAALAPGETMIYGPAANFARCKADGTVTLFTTTDGTYDGQSVYCQVRPNGFRALTPWGKIELNAMGFHVLTASGARIDAGAIGGLPAPLDSLGSYLKIAADILQLEGAAVSIGSAAGVADQLAKSTPTLAGFTAIATAFTAEAAAFTALAAIPALSGAAAALGTAATALGVAAGTLGGLAATLPSTSTGST